MKITCLKNGFRSFAVLLAGLSIGMFALASKAGEYWFTTGTDGGGSGAITDPFRASTADKFDEKMRQRVENDIIHLSAGTFETRGYINTPPYEWRLKSGQRILGSGIDKTILKRASDSPNPAYLINTGGASNPTDCEIADLTVDCDGSDTTTQVGISLVGGKHAIRRVRVIHQAFHGGSTESWGIRIQGDIANSEGNIIEDCEVSEVRSGACSAISFLATPGYWISGIIRNNRIFLPADTITQVAINPGQNAYNILIEGNYVNGGYNAVYGDTARGTNWIIAHNTFKNCQIPIEFAGAALGPWHRENISIINNNIDLLPAASQYSICAFLFLPEVTSKNILIAGNNIRYNDGGTGTSAALISAYNITGLTMFNNHVDSTLTVNFQNCTGMNLYDNYDLAGNPLTSLNQPRSVSASSITSSGAVGIGTTSPTAALDVIGTAKASTFSGSGANLTSLNASSLSSGTVSDARLSANAALLNANQTFSGANTFSGTVTVSGTEAVGTLKLLPPNGLSYGNAFISSASVNNQNRIYHDAQHWGADWAFRVGSEFNGYIERVSIGIHGTGYGTWLALKDPTGNNTPVIVRTEGNSYFNGGNVGIGTSSPSSKLDVNGTATVGGFRMTTGAATGNILTSADNNGNANWAPISSLVASIAPVIASTRNLMIANNPTDANNNLTITADEVVLKDANKAPFLANGINVTVAMPGSLDTGSETVSTWYYIGITYNGSVVSSILSTSDTFPTLPAGTYRALVGAVFNDANANFVQMIQNDRRVGLVQQSVFTNKVVSTAGYTALTSGENTNFRNIVSPLAKSFSGYAGRNTAVSPDDINFRISPEATTLGSSLSTHKSPNGTSAYYPFDIPLKSQGASRTFWYYPNLGGEQWSIWITGYTF